MDPQTPDNLDRLLSRLALEDAGMIAIGGCLPSCSPGCTLHGVLLVNKMPASKNEWLARAGEPLESITVEPLPPPRPTTPRFDPAIEAEDEAGNVHEIHRGE